MKLGSAFRMVSLAGVLATVATAAWAAPAPLARAGYIHPEVRIDGGNLQVTAWFQSAKAPALRITGSGAPTTVRNAERHNSDSTRHLCLGTMLSTSSSGEFTFVERDIHDCGFPMAGMQAGKYKIEAVDEGAVIASRDLDLVAMPTAPGKTELAVDPASIALHPLRTLTGFSVWVPVDQRWSERLVTLGWFRDKKLVKVFNQTAGAAAFGEGPVLATAPVRVEIDSDLGDNRMVVLLDGATVAGSYRWQVTSSGNTFSQQGISAYAPATKDSASFMGPVSKADDVTPQMIEEVKKQARWDPLESTCRHASLSIL